jgi:DNA polymerase-3 subunit delta
MTPKQLRAELARGKLRPAYLLAGEEALLRDDSLALIRAAVLAEGPADFNFDRLDGECATPGDLLDAVRTLPVMAARRLVVAREPEGQRGRSRGFADAVGEAAAELGPESTSVLVAVAAKVDRRARWVRAFAEPAAEVRCDPPRGARELAAFVQEEAERQGVALQPGVAELLCERTGPQLLMLRQEIAKLSLLVGPGEQLMRSHVVSATSEIAEEPIWELTDAIGGGRGAEALVLLSKLLRSGSPPPVVLGALVSHFRRLLRVSSGAPVSGPPFAVRKLEAQAQRYGRGRLLSCLRAIHETDTALKGEGSLRPELALERLVLGLAG